MDEINRYLSQLVQTAMQQLVQSYCVDVAEVSTILASFQQAIHFMDFSQ